MTIQLLQGKCGLIVGVANEHSIAAGCGHAFRKAGADLAIKYANAKSKPFVEPVAKRAEAFMKNGGCLLTMSYYGAEKVVDHYNIMGPVKSALEGTMRYMAAEHGPKGFRVNAISPGPLKTKAGSGIDHFDELIEDARLRAPEQHLVSIEDVGNLAMGLVSDLSRSVTGNVSYVDAGFHVMA